MQRRPSGWRPRPARVLGLVFTVVFGFAALGCSGETDRADDADTNDDNARASSSQTGTGGTTGTAGSSGGGASAGSGGSADVGSGGVAADLQTFHRAFSEAACAFEERCADINGRRYVNRDYCLEGIEYGLQFAIPTVLPYFVDFAYAEACIASQYPADSCDEPVSYLNTPACQQALPYVDPVSEGGLCLSGATYRRCDYGLECEQSGGCGFCVPAPERQSNGSPCTDRDECESGHCGLDQICVPRLERGEPCSSGSDCRGNLVCRGNPDDAEGSTCQDRPGVGESCADSAFICQHGLTCSEDDEVCVLEARLGSPCDRTGETPCAGVCNFESADARTGTCSSTYATVGEPCSYTGSSICFPGVAQETLDADGTPIACICTLELSLPVGSACRSDTECESSVCEASDPDDPSAGGTCREKLHVGEACTYHQSCESGYCTGSQLCGDTPECG